METAVRAVDNYEAKKKFIQLVPASFLGSEHIPKTWCTGHGRGGGWMEILPSPRFLQ